jgi:UDP-N-acetylglucosamine 3-dehydrogenase
MIRIGIIGAGPNGSGNAENLAKHNTRCRITAVADPVKANAEKLAANYSAKVCATPAELFEFADAVVISSPNFLHTEQAIQAANAGKHMFIEKPMALSVVDADKIVAAAEKTKVKSMIGFSVRFGGLAVQIKKMYDAGDCGDLISIWSRRLCDISAPEGHWRNQFTKSGGVMSELISHEIDFIVNTVGTPTSVYCRKASRLNDDPRANDHIWMNMGFANGGTGSIEGSQMSTVAEYYKGVVGKKGALHSRNWQSELYFGKHQSEANKVELPKDIDKHDHFLSVIEGKCESCADVKYGRLIALITEKALESAVSGQSVKIE